MPEGQEEAGVDRAIWGGRVAFSFSDELSAHLGEIFLAIRASYLFCGKSLKQYQPIIGIYATCARRQDLPDG